MREVIILAVVAFGAIFFVSSPSEDVAGDAADLALATGAQSGAAGGSAEDLAYAAWAAGETQLPRADDGHFYADVSINNASVHMLVDTGASAIALTGDDARALGLNWSQSDVAPIARGASGPVYGVALTLDRVQVGAHEARNVQAMIVPDGLGVSLLGQSFLSTVQPVRIEGETMVLGGG